MSSNVAVAVRGLTKTYQITSRTQAPSTLAELVAERLRRPFPKPEQPTVFEALSGVSFEVHRGEVLGIIGRNGAGKSTLLKILSQITPPTRGEADLFGRAGALLEVGAGFHPELTGRENIFLNGAILGMRRAEIAREFDSIVAFAETEQFLDTPVKRYSSGMYVRLAFAIAAHLRPEILIIDEVLAVGDLAFQRKCLGKMDEVAHRSGATVIFVSHHMSAVRKLCTRAILLERGRIDADGAVDAVLNRYLALNGAARGANTDLPPGGPGSPAQALALALLDDSGATSSTFRLGEPWRARLDFEVRRTLPHVIAAVGLRTLEGSAIATWWSSAQDLTPGRYRAEFRCEIPLAAGEFDFAIGISSNEQAVYYADGIGSLSISEAAAGPQPLRASNCGVLFTIDRPRIEPI